MTRFATLAIVVTATLLSVSTADAQESKAEPDPKQIARRLSWEVAFDLSEAGNSTGAIDALETALMMEKAIYGDTHEKLLSTFDAMYLFAHDSGAYSEAARHLRRKRFVVKRLFGDDSFQASEVDYEVDISETLSEMSGQLQAKYRAATKFRDAALDLQDDGYFGKAAAQGDKYQQLMKEVWGPGHREYAIATSKLAIQYQLAGDYRRSKTLYEEALRINLAVNGRNHPSSMTTLANFAGLYQKMGDYPRALNYLQQSLIVCDASEGKNSRSYAACLNNLASVHLDAGDASAAIPLFRQATEITEKLYGDDHPNYARALNNTAAALTSADQPESAIPLLKQALAIRKDVIGANHPDYASNLGNLALAYKNAGQYDLAERTCQQALQRMRALYPDDHPECVKYLHNLAATYRSRGALDRALPMFRSTIALSTKRLAASAGIQTEQQQILMDRSVRYYLDHYIECALAANASPVELAGTLLQRKGAVWMRRRQIHQATQHPGVAKQIVELRLLTRRISAMTRATAGMSSELSARLGDLRVRREQLESELMKAGGSLQHKNKVAPLVDVQKSMPPDCVLLNYFAYQSADGASICCSLIKPQGNPLVFDLGAAEPVAEAIGTWRRTYGTTTAGMRAGKVIRTRIWEPMSPHLKGIERILVSPDGVLAKIPFAALPGAAPDRYLIEEHGIVVIPVPQVLAMRQDDSMTSTPRSQFEMLLMGGVDYEDATQFSNPAKPMRDRPAGLPGSALASAHRSRAADTNWKYLPGTRDEIDFIENLHDSLSSKGQVIRLQGKSASEAAFRYYAPKCRTLHLATHGFFAPSQQQPNRLATSVKLNSELREGKFLGASPGELSGVVFAGANLPTKASPDLKEVADDGVVTAEELIYLDLSSVELCVLSACDTGLGEVAGGEGVLGLQRSLQIAGARSTITSLWKVNDAATQKLMGEFYRRYLQEGESLADALRNTQIWAIKHPDQIPLQVTDSGKEARASLRISPIDDSNVGTRGRLSPRYWAPFILSGVAR